jgi:hypothetical protein
MSRTRNITNDLTGMIRNAFIHAAKQGELADGIDAESAGDVFDAWLGDVRSTSIRAEAEDIDMGSRAAKAYIAGDLDGEPLDIRRSYHCGVQGCGGIPPATGAVAEAIRKSRRYPGGTVYWRVNAAGDDSQ